MTMDRSRAPAPSEPGGGPAASARGPSSPDPAPWDRIAELDGLLRRAGLRAGPDRWRNVHDLLALLAARRALPEQPLALSPLLAPLFCRSADEQRRFHELYRQWLGAPAGAAAQRDPAVTARQAEVRRRRLPQVPLRWVLLLLALLIAAIALGLRYGLTDGEDQAPPSGSAPPITSSSDVPAYEGPKDYLQVPLDPVPPRSPAEPIEPGPEARRWLAVADWLLPILPGLGILALLLWRGLRRRAVLRHRKGDASSPLRHLTLDDTGEELFAGAALRAALRRLHRTVPEPTRWLDADASVQRSARNNGLFVPVWRDLPRVPDLVVLVDRLHRDDHMAGLAERMVARLREAGLGVHQYLYQGDPTRLRAAGPGPDRRRVLGLTELATRHAGARLLVIGDAADLIDPWTDQAADWAEVLAVWPRRGLLASRPVPVPWRAALTDSGMALAGFGELGMARLAEHLSQSAPFAAADFISGAEPALAPLPEQLWQIGAEVRPSAAELAAVLAALDAWLGPKGTLLLGAAAVYPELNLELTRVLDGQLFGTATGETPDSRARRLLRLARLPWARHGWLPGWLRLALRARLDAASERRIASIYRELLLKVSVDGDQAVRLPLAVPNHRQPWPVRLRRAWRDKGWRLDRWIRDLVATAPADGALADRIFLDTVLRPGPLDLALPRRLRRLLPRPFRHGRAGWTRRIPWLAAPALAALLLAFGVHWLWSGGGVPGWPGPQLRQQAAAWLLAAEEWTNRAYRVEIRYIPRGEDPQRPNPVATESLAKDLAQALASRGFPKPSPIPLPPAPAETAGAAVAEASAADGGKPPAEDGSGRPSESDDDKRLLASINTVQIGADTALPAADRVAARLRYLAWGAMPQITNILDNPPPGLAAADLSPPPADSVRVWLRDTGHGGVFADPIQRTLSDEERAAFQADGGLNLPEPTAASDTPEPFSLFRDTLRDGGEGPGMIALPGGSFRMGSPDDEPERDSDEGPRHPVDIRPFAIGRTEVSFAEYDGFAQATGHKLPDDEGWGRGERPVINVSWKDAEAYADWLSDQSGQRYRLPSEAEWEYAARAGTTTPFWTGDCIHTDRANYNGKADYNDCGAKTGVFREKTVETGSLPANRWDLHEVAGNVWEWVEDCWHGDYASAPTDGSAWLEAGGGDCARRVVRGGGWGYRPGFLRSASATGASLMGRTTPSAFASPGLFDPLYFVLCPFAGRGCARPVPMRSQSPAAPQAVQSCHDILLWIIPQLDKLPRPRRFTLGERIESGLLDVLEQLTDAAYSRAKADQLRAANLRLDRVRHLWRLCHELKALPTRQYGHGAGLLEDLGRQIGAWRRDATSRARD
jgi:formylglycine-generating enzyme required for sulfatase activity